MDFDFQRFIYDNASAVFGLLGAVGGSGLSFIATSYLKKREFNFTILNKLIDRRITAHENVIGVAIEMRLMGSLGTVDANGEVRRMPVILLSKDEFDGWFTKFTEMTSKGSSWLSVKAKRELNYAQDYLVTLHIYLAKVSSKKYPDIGEKVRQDFIDISSSLEKAAFDFFESGIQTLRFDPIDLHHKYQRSETEKRLRATALLNLPPEIWSTSADSSDRS